MKVLHEDNTEYKAKRSKSGRFYSKLHIVCIDDGIEFDDRSQKLSFQPQDWNYIQSETDLKHLDIEGPPLPETLEKLKERGAAKPDSIYNCEYLALMRQMELRYTSGVSCESCAGERQLDEVWNPLLRIALIGSAIVLVIGEVGSNVLATTANSGRDNTDIPFISTGKFDGMFRCTKTKVELGYLEISKLVDGSMHAAKFIRDTEKMVKAMLVSLLKHGGCRRASIFIAGGYLYLIVLFKLPGGAFAVRFRRRVYLPDTYDNVQSRNVLRELNLFGRLLEHWNDANTVINV